LKRFGPNSRIVYDTTVGNEAPNCNSVDKNVANVLWDYRKEVT